MSWASQTWAEILVCLMRYCESGEARPHFVTPSG